MTNTIAKKLLFLGALVALTLPAQGPATAAAATPVPAVSAAEQSGVGTINIIAKRFEFSPNQITLKKGETIKLVLTTADVAHGFFSKPLKIDEVIEPGKTTEITVTPQAAGTFVTICDHFCGTNHGNMKMTIVVVE